MIAPLSFISAGAFLIFLEPDLGTALVVGLSGMAVLFAAGARAKHMFGIVAGGGLLLVENDDSIGEADGPPDAPALGDGASAEGPNCASAGVGDANSASFSAGSKAMGADSWVAVATLVNVSPTGPIHEVSVTPGSMVGGASFGTAFTSVSCEEVSALSNGRLNSDMTCAGIARASASPSRFPGASRSSRFMRRSRAEGRVYPPPPCSSLGSAIGDPPGDDSH